MATCIRTGRGKVAVVLNIPMSIRPWQNKNFMAVQLHCSCTLFFLFALFFPVPSAGDIVAVLLSSYLILLSLADACSCIFCPLFIL